MEREEHLFEALCKKGKAYAARRKAAGEKHGAYLMGRAVKVCKGQMSGKKKKKKKTNEGEGSDARDKASMMFNKIKVGDIIKTSKGEFKKIDDKHFEKVGKPGRKFTFKQMTFIKENEVKVPKRKSGYMGYSEPVKEEMYEEIDALHENETYCPKCAVKIKEAIREEIEKLHEGEYADRLANSGTDSDGRNTWGDKTGYSDEEMAQGKGKLKKYPDKDGRNVWGDKVDYSDEEKAKLKKEAKTKPAKGKRFAKKVKNPKTGRTRTVSYGQAGKAKKGGDRIRPGTAKGNAYCARSAKIKKCKNPPCANTLSRKKWKCQGSRSVK